MIEITICYTWRMTMKFIVAGNKWLKCASFTRFVHNHEHGFLCDFLFHVKLFSDQYCYCGCVAFFTLVSCLNDALNFCISEILFQSQNAPSSCPIRKCNSLSNPPPPSGVPSGRWRARGRVFRWRARVAWVILNAQRACEMVGLGFGAVLDGKES
jgi:hypothetical protein